VNFCAFRTSRQERRSECQKPRQGLVEASARPAYTTSPFNIPNHIRHHMRYVVPACGGLTEIPTEFQSLPCGPFDPLDARHMLAQPIRPRSLGFIVSSWVRSSPLRLSAKWMSSLHRGTVYADEMQHCPAQQWRTSEPRLRRELEASSKADRRKLD
jgi:hypothetical protein